VAQHGELPTIHEGVADSIILVLLHVTPEATPLRACLLEHLATSAPVLDTVVGTTVVTVDAETGTNEDALIRIANAILVPVTPYAERLALVQGRVGLVNTAAEHGVVVAEVRVTRRVVELLIQSRL
jgi:hypothetical protein